MADKRTLALLVKAKDQASKVLVNIGKIGLGAITAAATAATAALAGLTVVGAKAAKMAAEQELQERKLAAALRTKNLYTAETFTALKKQASGLQAVTDVGDETILTMQSLLLQFGASTKNVTALSEATLDLARTTGMDYQSAALQVGKAISGNVAALSRYGVQISKAKVQTGGAAAVLEELNKQFGGRARAEADTYRGAMQQLSNSWGDMWEQLGFGITQSGAVREALQIIRELVERAGAVIEENRETIQRWVKQGIVWAVDGIILAIDVIGRMVLAWQWLQIAFNNVARFVVGGIYKMVDATTRLLEALNIGGALDGVIESARNASESLIYVAQGFEANNAPIRESMDRTRETVDKVKGAVRELQERIEQSAVTYQSAADNMDNIGDAAGNAATRLALLNEELEAAGLNLEPLRENEGQPYGEQREGIEGISDAMWAYGAATLDAIEREKALEKQQKKTRDSWQALQRVITNATRSFATNMAAVIDGSKSVTQAVVHMIADIIQAIGNEALVKAAMEVAEAIAALARYDYPGAAAHFASAGKYVVTAAIATAAASLVRGSAKQAGGVVTGPPGRGDSILTPTMVGEGILTASQTSAVLGGRAAIVPLGAGDQDLGGELEVAAALDDLRNTAALSGPAAADWLEANYVGVLRAQRRAAARGAV